MIYFIANKKADAIKIGYTSYRAEYRLKALQTGNPDKLTLLCTMEGTEFVEKMIHDKFKHLRIRGEWFRDSPTLRDFMSNGDMWPVVKKKSRPAGLDWHNKEQLLQALDKKTGRFHSARLEAMQINMYTIYSIAGNDGAA